MTEVYLAQWQWDTSNPLTPFWSPPAPGAIGCLDLRSIPEMARVGGVPQGWGIFTYPAPVVIPGALALGDNLNTPLSPVARATIRIRLGLLRPLVTDSLTDVLWEVLTTQSDPTGLLHGKPLMPDLQGTLELRLGGFSVIKSKPFSFAEPEGQGVLTVLQEDYRRIRQERLGTSFADTHKHLLGALVQRFGLPRQQFIPDDLPDEGMLEPHTIITDSFNRANNLVLGSSSEGWSWTEQTGTWEVFSNKAAGSSGSLNTARAEQDLNTADQYSQGGCTDPGGTPQLLGPCVRFHAVDTTFYLGAHRNSATDPTYRLLKAVNAVYTALGSVADTAPGTGEITDKMSSNGSTQEFTSGGTVRITLTDTSITGNLRTGMFCQLANHTIDNFEASDLNPAPGGYPGQMHNRRPRSRTVGRGLRVP